MADLDALIRSTTTLLSLLQPRMEEPRSFFLWDDFHLHDVLEPLGLLAHLFVTGPTVRAAATSNPSSGKIFVAVNGVDADAASRHARTLENLARNVASTRTKEERRKAQKHLSYYAYYQCLPEMEHLFTLRMNNRPDAPTFYEFMTTNLKRADIEPIEIRKGGWWGDNNPGRRDRFDEGDLADDLVRALIGQDESIKKDEVELEESKGGVRHLKLDDRTSWALLQYLRQVLTMTYDAIQKIKNQVKGPFSLSSPVQ